MRVLTIVGVALGALASVSQAQHAHQVELGGYAAYTHYDPLLNINDWLAGGGRLGFFLNDFIGLEVSGEFAKPTPFMGPGPVTQNTGNFSLLLQSGGERNILYVLGGYSSMKIGSGGLNAVHGAIGDRIFFGSHVALRLEGGVFYAPSQSGTGTSALSYQGTAGLSFLLGGGGGVEETQPEMPKAKRDSILAAGGTVPETKPSRQVFLERGLQWPHQWFWGADAGLLLLSTGVEGRAAEPTFGGHWLITARRVALYVGYDRAFFVSDRHSTIPEPNGNLEPANVAFSGLGRILVGLLAFPSQKAIQPFAGGGLGIMEASGMSVTCTGCTPSDSTILAQEASTQSSQAFAWLMGGIDVRQGRLTLYGHYILTTNNPNSFISGVTHTLQGGIRYSLGSSREDAGDESR